MAFFSPTTTGTQDRSAFGLERAPLDPQTS
jgi:hypothetical protein